MKPSSIKFLLLVSSLFAPCLHAQDAPAKIREIEQKVLLENYQNAVHALVGSASVAGITPDLIGKRLQWLAMVDAEIEAGGMTPPANQEDMMESAGTLNELAWNMITSPDAKARQPEIALKLATIAIRLAGENADLKPKVLDTKARALFLLGKHEEAVTDQEKAIAAATVAEEKSRFEATLASYKKDELPQLSPPAHQMAGDTAGTVYIVNKLRAIVIPQIDFEYVSLEEAVDFLRMRAKEFDKTEIDPARKGVNFAIRAPAAKPAAASGPTSGEGRPSTVAEPGAVRIKGLHLRNVPLAVALKYICDATRFRYKVDDFAVTLVAQGDIDKDLFTRVFKVPSGFGSSLVSTQELLKLCGINFGEGASATLSSSGELLAVNTPSELDKIEQLIPMAGMDESEKRQEYHPEMNAASAGVTYLTGKLKTIVIPQIDFGDASVEEAVDFLRMRAKELDTAELDPGKKGVNFVIRRPRTAPAGSLDAGKAPTTPGAEAGLPDAAGNPGALRVKELRLRNVPLEVALKYICDQTKLRYKVDDFAVTLVPQSEGDQDIFTRSFRVPSNFGSPLVPIQELLKSSGIHFAKGSSVILSSSGVLMVTNTPTELDKIERLIEATDNSDRIRKETPVLPVPAPMNPVER